MEVMLIGNKNDLPRRQVTYEEGAQFAKANGLMFIETSTMTRDNVDDAFLQTAKKIYDNIQSGRYDLASESHGIKIGMPMHELRKKEPLCIKETPQGKCNC